LPGQANTKKQAVGRPKGHGFSLNQPENGNAELFLLPRQLQFLSTALWGHQWPDEKPALTPNGGQSLDSARSSGARKRFCPSGWWFWVNIEREAVQVPLSLPQMISYFETSPIGILN
jgi:hypothetical protein